MVKTPTAQQEYITQSPMNNLSIILVGIFTSIAIFLFATAPVELPDVTNTENQSRPIDVANLFNAMNAISDTARHIYTRDIVGGGNKAGLSFGEDWAEPGVEKGPLPALFLRLVANRMETKPQPLGLYLGSDQPINQSNLFSGLQANAFADVKTTRSGVFMQTVNSGYVAMYPDFASAEPCVTCHNEHPDSPKSDWKLNEVMGATTWTYPKQFLGAVEYLEVTESFYTAVREAYQSYLDKTKGFDQAIPQGEQWPVESLPVLPNANTFMTMVRAGSADQVLNNLVLEPFDQFFDEIAMGDKQ